MPSTLPVNIGYRAHSHLAIWAVISASRIWEQVGLEPNLRHIEGASDAEAPLLSGDVDFLSGNHITPYVRRAQGIPIIYLAQPFKATEDIVVSKEPLNSLADLRGRRIADRPLFQADGKDLCHPRGNNILYLERVGVHRSEVQWVEDNTHSAKVQMDQIHQGRADATFVGPSYAVAAREQGLHVLNLDPLPMVVGPTITAYAPNVRKNEELGTRLIRALAMGLRRFLDDPEGSVDVIERDVAPHMRFTGREAAQKLYDKTASNIEPQLYPSLEGVVNAFKLAQILDAEAVANMNPLSAWDLHYVQQLEEAGFFKELKAAVPA